MWITALTWESERALPPYLDSLVEQAHGSEDTGLECPGRGAQRLGSYRVSRPVKSDQDNCGPRQDVCRDWDEVYRSSWPFPGVSQQGSTIAQLFLASTCAILRDPNLRGTHHWGTLLSHACARDLLLTHGLVLWPWLLRTGPLDCIFAGRAVTQRASASKCQ